MGAELVLIAFLLGFLAWPGLAARPERLPAWLRSSGTAFLLLAAFLAGIQSFGLSRTHWLHAWDLFHTMVGTKYFAELGHTRLYECTIVFGRERLGMFEDVHRIRDLETLRYVDVERLLERSDCQNRFSSARKEAFVSDLAVFRSMMAPEHWKQLFRDKGYNGPPFHAFVASTVAGIVPFSERSFFWLSLVDLALIAGAFALVTRAFGSRVALVAFVLFCVNFPSRFIHMGGSFLRYDYVALLMAGFSLLRLERPRSAVACLALASMLRIFPVVFAAGLFARWAMDWVKLRRVPPAHGAALGVFVVTAAVAFFLSISHSRGLENWTAFAENIGVHTQRSATFRIGLDHLHAFHGEITAADPFVDFWTKARELERIRPLRWLVLALFAAPLFVAMRRLDPGGGGILFGMVAMFLLFQSTRYYYAILVLLCFVNPEGKERGSTSPQWRSSIGLLFLVSGVAYVAERWNPFPAFLYNYLFSGLLLLYFTVVLASLVRDATRPDVRVVRPITAGIALGSLALAVLVVVGRVSWSAATIEKPDGVESASRSSDLLVAGQAVTDCCAPAQLLAPEDLPGVAKIVAALWGGDDPPPADVWPERLSTPAGAVYVAVRRKGGRLAEGWETEGTTFEALRDLLRRLREEVGERAAGVDTLEIDLTHSYRAVSYGDARLWSNIRRGVDGLEIFHGGIVERYAPTYVLATNRKNARLVEVFGEQHGVSGDAMKREGRYRLFEAEQLLVTLDPPRAELLYRGNQVVPVEDVYAGSTKRLADLMLRWLVSNVHEDGRMTYLYWPSRGEEWNGNNMIRQWMATLALVRAGHARDDPALFDLAEKNIDYNLGRFYAERDGLGRIEWQGKVKLGAVALAALALVEHPKRAKWATEEAALRRTVLHLWNEDGSFRTFLVPAGRNDNQNFYPGEALLLWGVLYGRDEDPTLLERILRSFRYYREWHLDPRHRNPAFIPWHTQAYFRVWERTGNEELRDFVFEINDWLLGVQEWPDRPRYPDTPGRFYDPDRPFGPPHASSTGVYLEGLIDAFEMARREGDILRQARYRIAIVRGLRSLMQLQFADEIDMFYVSQSKRSYVHGGLRTTVYDNVIRCDNVQHGFMGVLRILERFGEDDYFHGRPDDGDARRIPRPGRKLPFRLELD